MKTANCALIADTSKFEAPIERAKTKLVSFGATIKQVSSYAQVASGVFNKMVGFSEKINTIAGAFRNVADGVKAVKSIIQNFPSIFEKIKTTSQGAYNSIKSISPALARIAVVAGVAGVAVFGLVKAIGAVKSVGSGTFGAISSSMKGLGSIAKGVGGTISGAFGGAMSMVGGVVGIAAKTIGALGLSLAGLDHFFKIGIMSAIELGDQYDNLNKRTGASIPFLYDFGKLLKNNGMDASSAGTAILSLQRSLGGVNELGQPTNEMIKRLGLNFEELGKLTPEKQVVMVLGAIKKLGSETEQTRALFEMFGRSGMALKGVLKDEAFSKLGVSFSKTGENLAKNASNFAKISAELRDSGSLFRDFFVSMAGEIAPSVIELFKMFSSGGSMLSGFGSELGKQIRFGADVLLGAFKSGMIFETLKVSFEAAGVILKDIFTRTINFASDQLANVFQAVVGTSMLSGIGEAIIGSFSIISGGLLKAFSTPIAFFAAGIQTAIESAIDLLIRKAHFLQIALGIKSRSSAMPRETGGGMASNFAEQKKTIGAFADSTMGAGFDSVKSGIADAVKGAKDSLGSLQQIIAKFPPESEEAKNALTDLKGKMAALAVASETSSKAIEESGGKGFLMPKEGGAGKGMSGAAVSSLQRIGGGGGAFGGDPLANAITKQTKATEENTKAVKESKAMTMSNSSNMVSNFLGGTALYQ